LLGSSFAERVLVIKNFDDHAAISSVATNIPALFASVIQRVFISQLVAAMFQRDMPLIALRWNSRIGKVTSIEDYSP
jgi:hypothetical protein